DVSGDVAKALLMERFHALQEERARAEEAARRAALEGGDVLEAEVVDEDALQAAIEDALARREAAALREDPSGLLPPDRPRTPPPAPPVVEYEYPEVPRTKTVEYREPQSPAPQD